MSDSTPVDLSDLQLMPDWLKEPTKKADPKNKQRPKQTGRTSDKNKKTYKRKNWERNRKGSAESKKKISTCSSPREHQRATQTGRG